MSYVRDLPIHPSENFPEVVHELPQTSTDQGQSSLPHGFSNKEVSPQVGEGKEVNPLESSRPNEKIWSPPPPVLEEGAASPPPKKWWKTRKGILVLVAIGLVVVAIILGVTLGVLLGGNSSSAGNSSPSKATATATTTATPNSSGSVCRLTVCPSMIAVVQDPSPSASTDSKLFFGLGSDSAVWYRQWDGSDWRNQWTSLGGQFASQPAAVTFESEQTNVWVVDKSYGISSIAYKNGTWDSSWLGLGGFATSPPTSCSHDSGVLDLFVRGSTMALHQMNWNTTSSMYSGWQPLGLYLSSSPMVSCSPGRMDVAVYGGGAKAPHDLWVERWDNSTWESWKGEAGSFKGDPFVVSSNSNRSDYFGVSPDGSMYHLLWTTAGGYGNWENIGGAFESIPSALVVSDSRIDVVAVGTDDRLKHKTLIDTSWSADWDDLGGSFNSAPTVVLSSSGKVSVFGLNNKGELFHGTWTIVNNNRAWSGDPTWTSDGGTFSLQWFRPGTMNS
ncbi:unnamed protein product [Clonostachys chloroleuca]|uniref:PLL-like beta propeller domain-containing protein n=1 Tax=Clonostachys chloroleuca TaxID=1926264 RepID=A0AA35LYA2_9HYPO|nr:unnamed protein product [Clonostachys chloroleuca]